MFSSLLCSSCGWKLHEYCRDVCLLLSDSSHGDSDETNAETGTDNDEEDYDDDDDLQVDDDDEEEDENEDYVKEFENGQNFLFVLY